MSPQPTVSIAKGSDPYQTSLNAIKLLDSIKVEPGMTITIKPNIVRPVMPDEGITTDPGVVEAIIVYLRERGVEDIVIAEGGNPGTDKAFKLIGLKELETKHGVGLVNLNKDQYKEVTIPNHLAMGKVKVAKTILECDGLINVPKMKIHHMAQVTLSLKNLMGVIVDNRGLIMHDRIDEKIADLASLFKPVLNVVDGIVGAEKDEVVGDPVRSNVIIAGEDMCAVDAVGSVVMGLDPDTIRHIQISAQLGLGEPSLTKIKVLGETIEAVAKKYSTDYAPKKLKTYGLKHPLSEADIELMHASFANRDPQVSDPYK